MQSAKEEKTKLRDEAVQKRMEAVRQRQHAALLNMYEAHSSVEQLKKQKAEHAIQVRLDVVAWREARAAEQQAYIESRKAQTAYLVSKYKEKQQMRDEAVREEEPGGYTDREIKSFRVRATPLPSDPPVTPRLAAARAARSAAATKVKAAAKRAADKRASSRRRESQRGESGALTTMLRSYGPELLAEHAIVIVQATGDHDRRVRLAAREGLNRLISCPWAKQLMVKGADVTAAALIQKLEDGDGTVRKAAIDVLALLNHAKLAQYSMNIVGKLGHSDNGVRLTSIELLAAFSPTELARHAHTLALKLEDKSQDVRRAVLETMRSFDEKTLIKHAEAVTNVLLKPDVGLRRQVMTKLLPKLPVEVAERYMTTLVQFLGSASKIELKDSLEVLCKLSISLVQQFAAQIVPFLQDKDPKVAQLAGRALCRLELKGLLPVAKELVEGLESPTPAQRISAIHGLRILPTVLEHHTADVVKRAADEVVAVRLAAMNALKTVSSTTVGKYAANFFPLLDDSESDVRRLAVKLLKFLKTSVIAPYIPTLILKIGHPDPLIRSFALKSLAKHDIAELSQHVSAQDLYHMVDDANQKVRLAAVDALACFSSASIAVLGESLMKLFLDQDRDPFLRQAICIKLLPWVKPELIRNYEGHIVPKVDEAYKNLDSEDWNIRKEACYILGTFANLSLNEKAHVVGLMKKLDDPVFEVSIAAGDALAKRSPTALSVHVEVFVKKLKEAHEGARMSAVKILNRISTTDGILTRQHITAIIKVGKE